MSDGPKKIIKDITKVLPNMVIFVVNKSLLQCILLQNLKTYFDEGPPGVGKTELANTAASYFKKDMYVCSAMRDLMN